MRAIAFALLLIAFPAMAGEMVARNGDDEVRIKEGPCVHAGTLALIQPADRQHFHPARGRFNGEDFFGCWRAANGGVQLVWEDGDQGVIPLQALKPAMDI